MAVLYRVNQWQCDTGVNLFLSCAHTEILVRLSELLIRVNLCDILSQVFTAVVPTELSLDQAIKHQRSVIAPCM